MTRVNGDLVLHLGGFNYESFATKQARLPGIRSGFIIFSGIYNIGDIG